MTSNLTEEDIYILKSLYGLNEKQILEAAKLYSKGNRSICACGKIIKERG